MYVLTADDVQKESFFCVSGPQCQNNFSIKDGQRVGKKKSRVSTTNGLQSSSKLIEILCTFRTIPDLSVYVMF